LPVAINRGFCKRLHVKAPLLNRVNGINAYGTGKPREASFIHTAPARGRAQMSGASRCVIPVAAKGANRAGGKARFVGAIIARARD
jgi:hypothetical protein